MIEIDLFSFLLGKKLAGGSDPITESLNVTENGTYTPSEGVDGFDEVVVNVSGGAKVKPMYMLFTNSSETEIDVSNADTSLIKTFHEMFYNCPNLTTVIGISDWDTSNVETLETMFRDCTSLTSLDLSGWNTSNVTNMKTVFYECNGLISLDLSSWETTNVTAMGNMFRGCTSLAELDIRKMHILTGQSYMFRDVPLDCHIIVKDQTEKDNLLTYGAFTNVEIAET